MIEYKKHNYELKYNIKRVRMIEEATGKPTLDIIRTNKGMLTINELIIYTAYGLIEQGEDSFVKPRDGLNMAEGMIETLGYPKMIEAVLEAIQRDCPFLFQAA